MLLQERDGDAGEASSCIPKVAAHQQTLSIAGGEEGSVIKTCVIAKFMEKPQWEMIQTQAEL
jgi:hypothetical protein